MSEDHYTLHAKIEITLPEDEYDGGRETQIDNLKNFMEDFIEWSEGRYSCKYSEPIVEVKDKNE